MGYDKHQRPSVERKGGRLAEITESTAASTALVPRGAISLTSISTGAPVVYTLSRVPVPGEQFEVYVKSVGSSSAAPFHINMASGVAVGSSSEDMLTLATAGDGATLRAFSSDRYGVVGQFGAAVSTST